MGGPGKRVSIAFASVCILAFAATVQARDVDLGEAGGVRYLADGSTADPADMRINCPGGTHGVSGGFGGGMAGATPSVIVPIDRGDPNRTPDDGWRVRLFGGQGDTVNAFAVCKPGVLAYARGKRRLVRAGDAVRVTARCPRKTHVVGGGAAALGAEIDSSYPHDLGDAGPRPDDAWRARVENGAGRERARAYAVCQRAVPAYPSVLEERLPGSGSAIFVDCPGGGPVLGGGLRLGGDPDFGDNTGGLHPNDGDNDNVPQDEYYTFSSNELSAPAPIPVTAFAICR
jgi:hypothetical protein